MTVQIGYAQVTITPSLNNNVYLAGSGNNRLATGMHDALYARALAIKQGEVQVILCALDLVGLGRAHCQEIQAQVNQSAPGVQVILACTHTHHGPDTIGLWGPDQATSGVDLEYIAKLKQAVSDVCVQALKVLSPAPGLKIASAQIDELIDNGLESGLADLKLFCMQFWSATAPLVNLLIFSTRPEIVASDNGQISSDYPGYLRLQIQAETHSPTVFCMGALGDLPTLGERTFEEAERIGRLIADAALKMLENSPVVPFMCFMHNRKIFRIPLSNPLFQSMMVSGLITTPLNGGSEVETEVNLLQFNQAGMVCVPGELLPKMKTKIENQLSEAGIQQTTIIGLANDEIGGIIPAEDFVFPADPQNPGEHFMETISVGEEAGPRLLAAVNELLG
jgi:hypothetical protein